MELAVFALLVLLASSLYFFYLRDGDVTSGVISGTLFIIIGFALIGGIPLQQTVCSDGNNTYNYAQNCTQLEHFPTVINVSIGTLASGSVSDLQDRDGVEVIIDEVPGDPGFDIRINTTVVNGNTSNSVWFYGAYDGQANHIVIIQLFNFTSLEWQNVTQIIPSDDRSWIRVEVGVFSDFVDATNTSRERIYHNGSGNAADDMFIDYFAIIQTETFICENDYTRLDNITISSPSCAVEDVATDDNATFYSLIPILLGLWLIIASTTERRNAKNQTAKDIRQF